MRSISMWRRFFEMPGWKAPVAVFAAVAVFVVSGCEVPPPVSPPVSPQVSYPAGQGRVSVDAGAAGFDHLSYAPLADVWAGVDPVESTQPELVLPAGEYVVTVYLADSSVYLENVSVEEQETAVVTPSGGTAPFERVLESASNYVVPLGRGSYLTYDGGSNPEYGVPGQEALDPFLSYEAMYSACPADGGKILLFGDAGPGVYDTETGEVAPYDTDLMNFSYMGADDFRATRCVDGAAQFSFGGGLARLSPTSGELIELELPPNPGYQASGTGFLDDAWPGYLADANADITATVTGNDHYASGAEKADPGELKPSRLFIGERGREEYRVVELGRRDDIIEVQLSPAGTKVAVQADTSISVYDTTTTQLLYTTPAQWTRFAWVDDNRLVYEGEPYTESVLLADVANRRAHGLNRANEVGPWTLTGYFDGYLYLTGADSAELESQGVAEWRGYRVAIG
ncbi:MAG: hypothetical protein LBI99_09885 [Propionibacteriaceae bacterium]|nr:hypothetical protein [Propionibacteriaceae bacterium]